MINTMNTIKQLFVFSYINGCLKGLWNGYLNGCLNGLLKENLTVIKGWCKRVYEDRRTILEGWENA